MILFLVADEVTTGTIAIATMVEPGPVWLKHDRGRGEEESDCDSGGCQ